jgi:branched-chain amino acid transport system permease protein
MSFGALVADHRWRWIAWTAVAMLLLALPFVTEAVLGRSWVRIIAVALLFVMLALGLNIVVGFAGLLDLGYIAFFAVGAYSYALLASPQFAVHWPFLVLLPLGAAMAAVFGILLGAPTLRLRGDYLAIVTLGFGEIIRVFLNNLNRPVNITNGPQGITLIDPLQLGGFSLAQTHSFAGLTFAPVHNYYFVFLACAALSIMMSLRLENSRIGRAWVAIRDDELAASAMGINTRNVKLLAFAMGATFGGVAGGLFASFQGFVSPESFHLIDSVMVLCMVVLGGMGNVAGVVLGAVLLTALPEALRYIGPLQQRWLGEVVVDPADLRMLLFGLALVLMMLLRPEGLWPARRRHVAAVPAEKPHAG